MNNVTFVDYEIMGETKTFVIIDRGNEEYTTMLKSTYDEMIAAQSTPIDTEDE